MFTFLDHRRWLVAMLTLLASPAPAATDLAETFAHPPAEARPWVYWFPLSGNLTKAGITADLQAMARVGIGGALYMEVDQGAPYGPADFAGSHWRDLLQHACREAQRFGLEINMNNDAGWCGSGGPWITPERSMQKIVWTETRVQGGQAFDGMLAQPTAAHQFYRDLAVLALPALTGKTRIRDMEGKASFKSQHFPPQPAHFPEIPADSVVSRDRMLDLTAKLQRDGRLTWDAPPGEWVVLRFGHTTTGKDNHPAPASGRGLECDKFSTDAVEWHYQHLLGKLVADNRALVGKDKVLVSTHIDSWEVGSQNWTPKMRQEFQQRRGYDLLPFLPTLTGRVVDSLELSERFLWDFRQTVSDLIVQHYAGHMRELANRDGLRLSIEAYDGVPCDEMTYAGQADEPMAEFWTVGYNSDYSCTEMASAAHTYGKRILGAEAFTSTAEERWQHHPGSIKALGDWAFCEGINRFVFHRFAAQPWTTVAPGMSMGPWGLHYERTQTWWEQSKAWHEYLARCQHLLQQGLFVADICYLQPEGAPRRFAPPPAAMIATRIRGGYNFDGCTPEVMLTRMTVHNGRLVLPDGMSYRALVIPYLPTMTPSLLRKLKELVDAGAKVFASGPPEKSPGLTGYPTCDHEVQQLAEQLWRSGKMEVAPAWSSATASGETPGPPPPGTYPDLAIVTNWLAKHGVPPDFTATKPLRYIHRAMDEMDVYFVANPEPEDMEAFATFRVADKQAELWWPDTGRMELVAMVAAQDGRTTLPLHLEPSGSVFVVFRPAATRRDAAVTLVRNGHVLATARPSDSQLDATTRAIAARVATLHCDASDRFLLEAWQPGHYEVTTASGKSRSAEVTGALSAHEITGPWELSFDPDRGGPAKVTFDTLTDWSQHTEPGIRFYSGIARYRTKFAIDTDPSPTRHWYLDLGRVAVMAEVSINGIPYPTLWKPPYRVDITRDVKRGDNQLEIKVVNLWANRQIGDEQLPEDSDRHPNGTLKSWPEWLQEGKPSPAGRFSFTSWRLWKGNDPLQPSGLLGPVRIVPSEQVRFHAP